MKTKIPLLFLCLCIQIVSSQEVFKTMFYNVLNYPLQQPTSRIQDLGVILNDYRPDIFMVCELNNEQGADDILNTMSNINTNYVRAQFVLNTSDDNIGNQNDLQNMLYYDNTKFSLESQHVITTLYRDFNHYILKLNTIDQVSNPIFLNVFICHLKSSSGTDNQALRAQMVDSFINYLNTSVADDSYVLLGGDLNLYTSSEPAFQNLINPANDITLTDPANRIGSWHNNTSYLDVFTQSTRSQPGLGGAYGGFDDRFDFIMTSESLHNNSEFFYVDNSYQVYGNNNNPNCFNSDINSPDCNGSLYSDSIRDALYYMSDHLPVTVELQTNEVLKTYDYLATNDLDIKFINGNFIDHTLNISVNISRKNIGELFIFNSLGQKVASVVVGDSSELSINISYLPSGLYYINIDNSFQNPLKFIKK